MRFFKKLKEKHYIQCGLAILLTGIFLYLTSSLWLSRNIIVSFEAEAVKDINYQVFYTEEKGKGFNQKQSVSKPIKSGKHLIEIVLPIKNLVKLRLDIGSFPEKVVIKDLKLIGSKRFKLNYSEFNKNQIDSFIANDEMLILSSNKGDPYITYKPELNLPGGANINWYTLVIFATLSFLIFNKFVRYLVKFKLEGNYSRIDIVMLALFFGMLWLPMSHISDAEKSEQENRMLAKKPQLMITGGGIDNFGVQFDAWYNDHFFGRDAMMKLYNNISYIVSPMVGSNQILVGKDGWLFFKGNDSLENYANITELNVNEMAEGLKYLQNINDWCKKHNKKFYYIIIPDKHRIYGEYYRLIKKQRSDDYSIANQFINYIRKNSDIKVMYLQDKLLKHKDKGLLYFKEGTHWSDLGAYYAYGDIIDRISKDYSLHKVKVDKWHNNRASDNGLLVMQSKGNKMSYGEIYKSPTYIKQAKCEKKGRYGRLNDGEITCSNSKNKYSIFVLRDSFFSWLVSYISDTFNKTKILWKKNIEMEDLKDIEQNYDIVILENVERFIPQILNQRFPSLPKEN